MTISSGFHRKVWKYGECSNNGNTVADLEKITMLVPGSVPSEVDETNFIMHFYKRKIILPSHICHPLEPSSLLANERLNVKHDTISAFLHELNVTITCTKRMLYFSTLGFFLFLRSVESMCYVL